jgi:hypothetical protein
MDGWTITKDVKRRTVIIKSNNTPMFKIFKILVIVPRPVQSVFKRLLYLVESNRAEFSVRSLRERREFQNKNNVSPTHVCREIISKSF